MRVVRELEGPKIKISAPPRCLQCPLVIESEKLMQCNPEKRPAQFWKLHLAISAIKIPGFNPWPKRAHKNETIDARAINRVEINAGL